MMDTEFTTLQYNNRHLVIQNETDKKPLVICECYLLEIAETICAALTDIEKNKRKKRIELENTTKHYKLR